MSETNQPTEEHDSDADSSLSEEDRGILQSMRFSDALLKAGYNDPMVLTWETAQQVMTEKRLEIIEAIGSEDAFDSHRELARHLERDIAQVQRDLDLLYGVGVLDREAGIGSASTPALATDTLVVSPLVVDGERLSAAVNYTGYAGEQDDGGDEPNADVSGTTDTADADDSDTDPPD